VLVCWWLCTYQSEDEEDAAAAASATAPRPREEGEEKEEEVGGAWPQGRRGLPSMVVPAELEEERRRRSE
jgi:hypothetical protein